MKTKGTCVITGWSVIVPVWFYKQWIICCSFFLHLLSTYCVPSLCWFWGCFYKVGGHRPLIFSQREYSSVQSLSHVWLWDRWTCPSSTPRTCSNSCPSSWWCYPTISSSVIPFSSCLQSFPASESFPVSQFLTSGGQSIGVSASASVLPMSIQDWFPLGLTCFALVCSLHRTTAHQWRRWGKALLLRWWLSVQRRHKNQSAC